MKQNISNNNKKNKTRKISSSPQRRKEYKIDTVNINENTNQDFSKLPGIVDICTKLILPYLACRDLINVFARTTKEFLSLKQLRYAYYRVILYRKYCIYTVRSPGFPSMKLFNGARYGTLTSKDTRILVDEFQYDINLYINISPPYNLSTDSQILADDGYNILHIASAEGYFKIVYFLIEEFHMNVNTLTRYGKSAIYLSAFYGHNEVVEYLLSKGGCVKNKRKGVVDGLNVHYKKEFGETIFGECTPFIIACEKGRLDDVKLFITNHDATLNEMVNQVGLDSNGWFCTPLGIATKNEHYNIVQYLIAQQCANNKVVYNKFYGLLYTT